MARKSLRSYIVPHLLRTLLGERETVKYPFGELELPEDYRGAVVVDIDKCVGCGLCARNCPCETLIVERLEDGGVRIQQDYGSCAECGECEFSCPRDAIYLVPRFQEAALERDTMVLVWERCGAKEKRKGKKEQAEEKQPAS